MDIVDWSKLKPYKGDTKKSFEELCYQIVVEKFSQEIQNGAKLTPVDDSGGGDGVEFYLTRPNGDVWGWQAKSFSRLGNSQKEQIKKSLQTAYKKHPKLKKWYLCTQFNFTPGENTWFNKNLRNSKKSSKLVLPKKAQVELIHWGESKFLDFFRTYSDVYNFFFSDNLFTEKWFLDRYKQDLEKSQIKAKYESEIHIPTEIDDVINKILGGQRLQEIFEKEFENQQVRYYADNYTNERNRLFSEDVDEEFQDIQDYFRELFKDKAEIIEIGVEMLEDIKNLIVSRDEKKLKNKIKELDEYTVKLRAFLDSIYEISTSDLCKRIDHLDEYEEDEEIDTYIDEGSKKDILIEKLKKILRLQNQKPERYVPKSRIPKKDIDKIKTENRKRQSARDVIYGARSALSEYAIPSLEWCWMVFRHYNQQELHIHGEAGMGKTHVSFNIYEDRLVNLKEKALFIFAKDITSNNSLEAQILELINAIPNDWSLDDLLGALNIAGRIDKKKIPIIIDGLNESAHWHSVWKNGLEQLLIKVKQDYPQVVIITTYRTSYEEPLFPQDYFNPKVNKGCFKLKERLQGFKGLTSKALKKYLEFYKIKLQNYSGAVNYFEHPLHLKIFCETKNPERKKEVELSFQNEDLFDVFDEYISQSNIRITHHLNKLGARINQSYTNNKLSSLAKTLWENNSRGIHKSLDIFTDQELIVFEGENLLIFRDWNTIKSCEEIQFTYDLLGGYLISKYLIEQYSKQFEVIKFFRTNEFVIKLNASINKRLKKKPICRFYKSRVFFKKLLNTERQHPLFDDILRTLNILSIKDEKVFMFDVISHERSDKYAEEALFEINKKHIIKNENHIKKYLTSKYQGSNKKWFYYDQAENIEFDPEHPLNFIFWSDLLKTTNLTQRDLDWTEYIRKNHSWYGQSEFANFIKGFENACIEKDVLSERVHVAAYKVTWTLTSTIRRLRDEATRALYYYGRRFPEHYLALIKYSLSINDPYVSERVVASAYGVCMACHRNFDSNDFSEKLLKQYAQTLFSAYFAKDAPHPTSHILTRDYAKRTIELALIYYPNLLNTSEKELLEYPMKSYKHMTWGESEDLDDKNYRNGDAPIHMDFENYTIGSLVKGRSNYDSSHSEYKTVLANIYWRIYNLGYSLKAFSQIDQEIANDRHYYHSNEESGKTDRYGKKYSWIAFYEMAGIRHDLGLFKGWDDEFEFRISDVDIDPSFPIDLKEHDIRSDLGSFLGDPKKPAREWQDNEEDLDLSSIMSASIKLPPESDNSDWVLLKAFIAEKDDEKDHKRDSQISINAVLVDDKGYKALETLTKNDKNYFFEYLRGVEDHYLFEGEIPWSKLMSSDYEREIKIVHNKRVETKKRTKLTVLKNNLELTDTEKQKLKDTELEILKKERDLSGEDDWHTSIFYDVYNVDHVLTKKAAKKLGFEIKNIQVSYDEEVNDITRIDAEYTTFENAWEGYHTDLNTGGDSITPSKNIAKFLGLSIKPQTSDLYSEDLKLTSTAFKFGNTFDNTSRFCFIKKDALGAYLEKNNKKIVWFQWAEKRYFPNGISIIGSNRDGLDYRNYYKVIL